MPYIDKNQTGHITGVYECQQHESQEFVETAELWTPPLTYSQLRAAAYPPIGDQLDAKWKGGEAEAAMLKTILAVKAKYPKA